MGLRRAGFQSWGRRGERGESWPQEVRGPPGAHFHAASQAPCASRARGPPPPPRSRLSLGSTLSKEGNPRPQAQHSPLPCSAASPSGPRASGWRLRRPGPKVWAQAWLGGGFGTPRQLLGRGVLSDPTRGPRRVSCRDPEAERGQGAGLTQRPRARPPPSVSSIHLLPGLTRTDRASSPAAVGTWGGEGGGTERKRC